MSTVTNKFVAFLYDYFALINMYTDLLYYCTGVCIPLTTVNA